MRSALTCLRLPSCLHRAVGSGREDFMALEIQRANTLETITLLCSKPEDTQLPAGSFLNIRWALNIQSQSCKMQRQREVTSIILIFCDIGIFRAAWNWARGLGKAGKRTQAAFLLLLPRATNLPMLRCFPQTQVPSLLHPRDMKYSGIMLQRGGKTPFQGVLRLCGSASPGSRAWI